MNSATNSLSTLNKLRIRVCGLLIQDKKILLINHKNITPSGNFWSPPGGGVDYGEPTTKALIREFNEEINLNISVSEFIVFNEHLQMPLHAIELFYKVNLISGTPALGNDPEFTNEEQILADFHFFSKEELYKNQEEIHPVLLSSKVLDLF